jgi:hypothetical protein
MPTEPLPPLLSKVVAAIGCLYSAGKDSSKTADATLRLSNDLWSSGRLELETFVRFRLLPVSLDVATND